MIKPFVSLLLCSSVLSSNIIDIQWLSSQDKTYAKDFYIWQYLKQKNISEKNATKAFSQSKLVNKKILYAYSTHTKDEKTLNKVFCMKKSTKELLLDSKCISYFSTSRASLLNKVDLKKLILLSKKSNPTFSKRIKIFLSKDINKDIKKLSPKDFLYLYKKTSKTYRQKHLNINYSAKFVKKLENYKYFATFIKYTVLDPKLKLAQKSLFSLDSSKYSSSSNFYLAMNLISNNKGDKALKYLDFSYKKTSSQSIKDKINFWKYLLTNKKNHLKDLMESNKINMYTLFAHNYYKKDFNNIVYDLTVKGNKSDILFNKQDQFEWIKVLRDTKKMSKEKMNTYKNLFNTEDLLPHLAYVSQRYNKYQLDYFIKPYDKYTSHLNTKRKNLINAIAKQESRFIPSSISTAYAMGVMQIMPFLSKAIAKSQKEEYDIFTMLEAKKSLRYANLHLNYLEKRFKNPLLIAYAYNAGGGFTSSVIKKGLFVKKGKYEPYISMELFPYAETREYGKKVLTNYIIYSNNKNVSLKSTLSTLKKDALKSINK